MKNLIKRTICATLIVVIMAGLTLLPVSAESDFEFTYPEAPLDVDSTTGDGTRYLTTLTQRAASEIPLVFGMNVPGGNMFNGLRDLAGTLVNQNPDPYIWNFNYLVNELGMADFGTMFPDEMIPALQDNTILPAGSYYMPLGNVLGTANGLYNSGGANQNYSAPVDEVGGVGYAVGYRSDVIIGFSSSLVDQIDLVNSWVPGDDFYIDGDENYSPLIIDVQTGSVTSRLYAWNEMGQAIDAYLAAHPGLATRYGSATTTASRLTEFSVAIPYYIASLIADGKITKKTAAYISDIDGYTMTCVDPGTLGNVRSDTYATVRNLNFIDGIFTISELMDLNPDIIILGASGYGYSGSGTTTGATTGSDKATVLSDIAALGFGPDQVPMIMDDRASNVTVGSNGYNFSPLTPLFLPYIQTYCYMDELDRINEAVNPAAMVQFMVNEFMHVTDSSAANVALYYIGTNWDSVDEEYDVVPNIVNYVYDKAAIEAAIKEGVSFALSGKAAVYGNTMLPAFRNNDTAYLMLINNTVADAPPSDHDFITVKIEGQTKYLDLTELLDQPTDEPDNTSEYVTARTSYQAIIDYYNSGVYGYGDDLTATLQNYADHMIAHVWVPDTSIQGGYSYGMSAGHDEYNDVTTSSSWFYDAVYYATDRGLFQGDDHNNFNPGNDMTMAELITICYRLAGNATVAESPWYASALAWAKENDLVTDDSFNASVGVTREDFIVMFCKTCAMTNRYDMTRTAEITSASDYADVAAPSRDAVAWAVGSGMIEGTTGDILTISPKSTITRAEVAQMAMRFYVNA